MKRDYGEKEKEKEKEEEKINLSVRVICRIPYVHTSYY